ncbi:hypothetical protein NLU13_1943 [Sarocladium strictum]|uniref:NAD-dependent epimerase/dehydratase domain-containing protein n=1 Tax=Sarocladium strictum TaxID=5046 RepID=A0AA39LCP7_SARSR|nr:hypothetical protein NLU13_1943 [Sarocladium strictum]
MRVLITGAAGFVGQLLAQTLLNDHDGKYHVVLTDIVEPPIPNGVKWPQQAKSIKADLLQDSRSVVDKDIDAVFVFHGIMSSGSEADYELGMRVNFGSSKAFLDVLREVVPGVKVIYTSSQAVYGGNPPEPITESTRPTPESSYGAEKLMCEYLVNDLTRRGFINGIVCRLPTVSVRPGRPTAAASSFLSGMIREPMQGLPCTIPIKNRAFAHCVCSPRILVKNLIYALDLPKDALPAYDRVVNLPGMRVTVQDMIDSLERVGGKDKLQYLKEEEDEALKSILYSWPAGMDYSKGLQLGFFQDSTYDDAVRDFQATLVS